MINSKYSRFTNTKFAQFLCPQYCFISALFIFDQDMQDNIN